MFYEVSSDGQTLIQNCLFHKKLVQSNHTGAANRVVFPIYIVDPRF